ncbi:MAG: nickel-dependent lactate racemase [Deltaproteobacteria bacterium]|nr:nickel-dependent lactate racemase [Deltaproteobacteria bacterium]
MRIVMKYGKKGLPLQFPDDIKATIIRKRKMLPVSDPEGAVKTALSPTAGSKTLVEEAQGKKNVCILICDITRPAPNAIVLPVLIQELIRIGFASETISVLVATGCHRPNEREELRELIGNEWVLKNIHIVNHFARREADHIFLGTTPGGTPVKMDRRFVNSDLRIVIGLVEPHFMAGYSGGRKVVIPGIAHEDSIRVLHSTRILGQEGLMTGRLEGNPLQEELLSAVRMAGKILAINTVIDEDRNLCFINFGSLEESHLAAVAFARPCFEIPVSRKYKTVVTGASGYPLDKTYYQTVKGMVGVVDILEPGADIFIVSECSEGLGSREYAESQKRFIEKGAGIFWAESLSKPLADIDEWETVMQIKAMKQAKIHLFSEGLNREEKTLTGVEVIGNLSEAIQKCLARKEDKQLAVIPEGPFTLPVYRPVGSQED